MQRRQFLATSLAASTAALTRESSAQTAAAPREYYQIRRYQLQSGPQSKLAESYFSDALIPALTRMGIGPVGAFRLDIGPETPAFYSLVPGSSIETLATLDLRLAQDAAFLKAAEPFWNAPASTPAFVRVDGSLLAAFTGWPKLTPPSSPKPGRIFQLRTYESASHQAHIRKVEMFNQGELEIFTKSGLGTVFFGDTLAGQRMPSLTYMLSFPDMNELNTRWAGFVADPAWKKLSSLPQYRDDQIVSNISNLILKPLTASQI